MHIALFGGSFNPPHVGHMAVAINLVKHKLVDQVWFMPVKTHPFSKEMWPVEQRLTMLELSLKNVPAEYHSQLVISHFEVDQPGVSYSYQTLKALQEQYPEHSFSWVIGSDNISHFHKWKDYQQMLDEFTVFVYPRQGYPLSDILPGMWALPDFPEVVADSTSIRDRLKAEQSIQGLVDPDVDKYIRAYLKNHVLL